MKISRSVLLKAGAAIAILGVGLGAMFLLSSSKAEANKREVEPPLRKVETFIPQFKDIPYIVDGNGMVESSGSIEIYGTVSGKVTYSFKDLQSGTAVSKGELLLKIDSRQAENTLNLARAELIKAVASIVPQFKTGTDGLYGKWNSYLNSLNFSISDTRAIPEVSSSREKLLISTFGIYSAYYNVKNAEIQLEQHNIIAPFDGYISGSSILENSFISAGQPLFTLVDAENLKVSVPLTVDELSKIDVTVRPEVTISTSIGNAIELKGNLISKDIQMDRFSQMMNVYIEFTNPDLDSRFAPGNYVDISIAAMVLTNTAAVPRYAVIDNSFVYTYKDKLLSRENISIRAVSNDTVYMENTLPPDTEIITTILQKPLLGMKLSSLADDELVTGDTNEEDS